MRQPVRIKAERALTIGSVPDKQSPRGGACWQPLGILLNDDSDHPKDHVEQCDESLLNRVGDARSKCVAEAFGDEINDINTNGFRVFSC